MRAERYAASSMRRLARTRSFRVTYAVLRPGVFYAELNEMLMRELVRKSAAGGLGAVSAAWRILLIVF